MTHASSYRSRASSVLGILVTTFLLSMPVVAAAAECSDGLDNDRDGRTDYPTDDDCDSRVDNLERPTRVDLTLTLTDNVAMAHKGDLLTYVLTVRNNLSEPYDAFTRITLSNLTYAVGAPEGALVQDSRTIILDPLTIDGNQTRTVTFTARIVDHAPDNAAVLARVAIANVSATDQTILASGMNPPAEVSVQISDDQETAEPGALVTYDITVHNLSAYLANNLNLSASMPVFGEFVSATGNGIWDNRNVRWNKMLIPANASSTVSYTLRVRSDADEGRILQASAFVAGQDDTDTTTIGAASSQNSSRASSEAMQTQRIVFRKDIDKSEVVAGGEIHVTISIRNTTSMTLHNLQISEQFDSSMLTLQESGEASSTSPGLLLWDIPSLAAGQSWQTMYTATVQDGASHGTMVETTARLTGDDVSGIAAADRTRMTSVGVLRTLPTTGVALDIFFILVTTGLALSAALAHRRSLRM